MSADEDDFFAVLDDLSADLSDAALSLSVPLGVLAPALAVVVGVVSWPGAALPARAPEFIPQSVHARVLAQASSVRVKLRMGLQSSVGVCKLYTDPKML